MKRLMFALAAAAGVALGAYAEEPEILWTVGAVSFEEDDPGVSDVPGVYDLDSAEFDDRTEAKVWYTAAEENPTEVRAYEGATKPDDAGYNFLHVETDAKPLFRTFANAAGIGHEIGAKYIPLDKVMVDTWVKFTAWDSEPTFAADDDAGATKFALWLQTSEDETQTNLYVKCGSVNEDGDATPISVKMDVSDIDVTAWHHVVVKTILDKKMGEPGLGCFTIAIDGAEVAAVSADYAEVVFPDGYEYLLNAENKKLAGACKLFPSMVKYDDAYAGTLFGVGFQGTGDIDLFTAAPYEEPVDVVEFSFKDVTGLKVASVELEDGTVLEEYKVAPGTKVIVTYEPNGDYILKPTTVEYTINEAIEIDPAEDVEVEKAAAKIGTALYLTLKEAVDAVGEDETIELLENCASVGIRVEGGKNFTIDFAGKTVTFNKPGAGSPNTQTQAFQLLQGSTIVFKNGTICCSAENKDMTWGSKDAEKGIAMIIQNYANLTLEGMTIDGANIAKNGSTAARYLVSNNSGDVVFENTIITANEGDIAFDTCKYKTYTLPTVEVKGTSAITGDVELSGGNLTLTAGELNGELIDAGIGDGVITKADGFEADAPAGYKWDAEGKLVKIEYATLTIEQVANCTIVVSNDTEEVVTGAKFDKDEKVELTVYRTPAEGYELDGFDPVEAITMSEDVTVTAAVKEKQKEAVKPGEPVGLGNGGDFETQEEAQAAAEKLPIVIEQADIDAGLTVDAVTVKAEFIGGSWQAVLEPKEAPVVDDSVALEVTTENFGATVENPVPGVYYGFVATETLGTAFEAVGDYVRAKSTDKKLTLTAPKGKGNACFYKLNAVLRPPKTTPVE